MNALAALTVSARFPVFPCNSKNKRPQISKEEGGNGFHGATQDEGQILAWWAKHPDALVGVPTGTASGLVVVDEDTIKKPDAASSAWVETNRIALESGAIHTTRSGGHHFLFNGSNVGTRSAITVDGVKLHSIDTRGDGGYIIWWPAHGYESRGEIQQLPAVLIAQLSPSRPKLAAAPSVPAASGSDWVWNAKKSELESALTYLDPNDRDEWVMAGMSIQHANPVDGFELWHRFSAGQFAAAGTPRNYVDEADCRKTWRSFGKDKIRVPVTIDSIFKIARDRAPVSPGTVPPPPSGALAPRPSVTFRHIADIVAEKREAQWLIHKVIERSVLAVLAGPRGTFKSFVALDWSMRSAVAGHSGIILSGEGAGLDRRVDAWTRQHWKDGNLSTLPLIALERPLNLNAAIELEALRAAIGNLDSKPSFVVVDTFSKFTAGLDENDNTEVAAFLSGISRAIREEFDSTVLIVAHSGHSDPGRPRGASSLMANPDAEYIIERREMLVTVSRDRFKDAPSLPPLAYEAKVVDLGRKDLYGEPVTSLALLGAIANPVSLARQKMSARQSIVFGVLRKLSTEAPATRSPDAPLSLPVGKRAIRVDYLTEISRHKLTGVKDPAYEVARVIDALHGRGAVSVDHGFIWIA